MAGERSWSPESCGVGSIVRVRGRQTATVRPPAFPAGENRARQPALDQAEIRGHYSVRSGQAFGAVRTTVARRSPAPSMELFWPLGFRELSRIIPGCSMRTGNQQFRIIRVRSAVRTASPPPIRLAIACSRDGLAISTILSKYPKPRRMRTETIGPNIEKRDDRCQSVRENHVASNA
jgi:hypothetical protein